MFDSLLIFLAQASEVANPGPSPAGGDENPFPFGVMVVIMVAIFYFLVLRPQQAQEQELKTMVDELKKNDQVVTSGGVIGIVQSVKQDEVVLKIDDKKDVKIRVVKHAIKAVLGKDKDKDNSTDKK